MSNKGKGKEPEKPGSNSSSPSSSSNGLKPKSSLARKLSNFFHKKQREPEVHETQPSHPSSSSTQPSSQIVTVLKNGGCPCRNILDDDRPRLLFDAFEDTHLRPKAKGEFDLIFEGPKAQANFEIFAKSIDRFSDIISLYGEVTWSSQQSSKNNHGDERVVITGSFVSGLFGVRGHVDYGHLIKVALSRVYNKNSTIVNPKFGFFPPQIQHKALSFTCPSLPALTNVHVKQSITTPASLVWILKDQSVNPEVYPTAWRVMNLNSSSPPQSFLYYHQFAVGVVTVSGSTVTPLSWLETNAGVNYETFASPNNLNFSPSCGSAPEIMVTNTSGGPVNYAIGFSNLGGGSDPDTFDITGVTTAPAVYSILFNNTGKAENYKLYCNLTSNPTQGELITWNLPTDNIVYEPTSGMFSFGTDIYFLLSELDNVYTFAPTDPF